MNLMIHIFNTWIKLQYIPCVFVPCPSCCTFVHRYARVPNLSFISNANDVTVLRLYDNSV